MNDWKYIWVMISEFFRENGMQIALFIIGAVGNWFKNRKQNLSRFDLATSAIIGGFMAWLFTPFVVYCIQKYAYNGDNIDPSVLGSMNALVGFIVGTYGMVLTEQAIYFVKNKLSKK